MADDEDQEEEGPAVELGEHRPVEGAPITRLTARLHYGIERSEVDRRLGEEEIRTPDGPRQLGNVLDSLEETYFPRQQDLEAAVRDAVGHGTVPAGEPEPEAAGFDEQANSTDEETEE